MNFGLTTEQVSDSVAVIALSGEVDLYTAPDVKRELLRVIEEGAGCVIVDLTQTTFIDSTTLGVLISGVKRLRPEDGRLELVIADRNIRKIFEITGLDRVFPIHDDREAALQSLAGEATAG
jgi:anti-sigma B factor antagonist